MKWIFIFLIPGFLHAQKEDYIWVIGDSNTPNTTSHGGMIIDFNHLSPLVSYHYRLMNMSACNASICDSPGKLLFYSNGCDIANEQDQILYNGNEINPGYWHETLCDKNMDGYWAGYPSMVILPLPGSDSLYYLFHKSVQYVQGPPEDAFVDKLLYSIINVTSSGKRVEQKNIPLMEDKLAAGEMLAVKHANGADWWLITPKRNSNQFYVFLFTSAGIVDTLTQTIGDMSPPQEEGSGQTNISPDGSLMVRYFPYHPAMLYDFDRATGRFSNYSNVNIDFGTAWAFDGGCVISPNNRYLYISAMKRIYQFDLWADNISTTQTTVAEWDGFIDPISTNFYTCQLGPDCKIYIIAGGDTRYYHIIHNPDAPGMACNVEQHGLVLPTPSGASIPYFPNYRLGPLDNPGKPCTPTVSVNPGPEIRLPAVRAWPNPASTQLHLAWDSDLPGEVSIALYDVYGRLAQAASAGSGSDAYTLPLRDVPAGLYRYVLQTADGARLGSGAMVVKP